MDADYPEQLPVNRPHRCIHLQGRGNRMPRFAQGWWCPRVSNGVSPQPEHGYCSPDCKHYTEKRAKMKERPIMPAKKNIRWEGPATVYFPGADEADMLWFHCWKLHDMGQTWQQIGDKISEGGLAGISVQRAVEKYDQARREGEADEGPAVASHEPSSAGPKGKRRVTRKKDEAVPPAKPRKRRRPAANVPTGPTAIVAAPPAAPAAIVMAPTRTMEEALVDTLAAHMDTVEIRVVSVTGRKRVRKGSGASE